MSARPPAPDDQLDSLLAEWAAGSRLTAAEAEDVRLSVVGSSGPGLDPTWWRELVGQVSATVIGAACLPESARSALGGSWATPAWGAA